MVNPDNIEPLPVEVAPGVYEYMFPASVNSRVPEMIFVMVVCWTILLSIGMLAVSNYKVTSSELQYEELEISLL